MIIILTKSDLVLRDIDIFKEFLNLKKASEKEFRERLKQNSESCGVISDKTKAEKYVNEVINIIKSSNVPIRGICIHYLKLVMIK